MKFLWLCLIPLCVYSLNSTNAQECACQPTTITFQLALDQTCNDDSLASPGIQSFECTVENKSAGEDVGIPPAVITSIQILEFNAERQLIGQSFTMENFRSGDTVEFQSEITGSSPPKSLQALITGVLDNAESDEIINTFIIDFANDCLSSSDTPLLSVGQSLGWLLVVRNLLC